MDSDRRRRLDELGRGVARADAKSRDIVTVALRDCTYSATDEAQAASLANIDDFLGYVMNADEVVKMLKA